MKKIFGTRLKKLRTENDEYQADLAKLLQVDTSMISLWENGKNYPTATMLQKIAKYFNVSTDYLLGKTDIKIEQTAPISLDEFQVAFYGEVKELSPEAKEKVLEYARLLKISEESKK